MFSVLIFYRMIPVALCPPTLNTVTLEIDIENSLKQLITQFRKDLNVIHNIIFLHSISLERNGQTILDIY